MRRETHRMHAGIGRLVCSYELGEARSHQKLPEAGKIFLGILPAP